MEKVSIIVTTKNEEKNIENCLRSIEMQTYKDIEIIVVDNKSDDKTKEIAKKYAQVYDKGPERSAQRNFGMINKSKGKYVMFIDADMMLHPELIEKCVNFCKSEDADALHIPEVVLGKQFFSKVRRFERSFYNGTVIDGARFFLKKSFVKVKGFDESMSGPEDWDIDKKIKKIGKISLLPVIKSEYSWDFKEFMVEKGVFPTKIAIYHNESEFDIAKYLSKKAYYAQNFDVYINKWGKNDKDIKKQFGVGYRFFGVYLENGKWKKLFLHPILTFGMYFLRFLVGIKFLTRKK